MKRKIIAVFTVIFIFCSTMVGLRVNADSPSADFEYEVNDDQTITITDYIGSASDVVIPSEIDGKKVTAIDARAMDNKSNIQSLVVSEGVTDIGGSAFGRCLNLKTVTLPNTLETVGVSVFGECRNLETVNIPNKLKTISTGMFLNCKKINGIVLPEGIEKINANAFDGCDALESINIPKTVTFIGKDAFIDCAGLKKVTANDASSWCKIYFEESNSTNKEYSSNPVAYGCELAFVEGSNTKIEIDNSVTRIPFHAFSFQNIEEVVLPDTIETIGMGAFLQCKNLAKINLPNGLIEVKPYAFNQCDKLEVLNFPESVTRIGFSSFSYCTALKEITFPKKLEDFEASLYGCPNLTHIKLPEGTKNITVRDCENLNYLYIPKDMGAFVATNFVNSGFPWHILYEGTEEEWFALTSGTFGNLSTVKVHFNAKYEDIVITEKEPACEQVGEIRFHCNLCSEESSVESAALEHEFDNGKCIHCYSLDPNVILAQRYSVHFDKKSIKLKKGKKATLKVKIDGAKKAKFSVDKKSKKIIKVVKTKKKSIIVKGKKKGTAKVVAKVGNKKATCKVKVK